MFDLKKNNTTPGTELTAGLTTFFTMAYIIVVNPLILSDAGVPFQQGFTATIIATIIGTLFMAVAANYPIAVAPAMGTNVYFAYTVIQAHSGIGYSEAFSALFITGILFFILSLTRLRSMLIRIIPENLKYAITSGIGLFIAFIGLRLSGIIKAHPSNLVGLGNLHSPSVVLALAGLAITLILITLNVPGAIFIGIVLTGIIAMFTGQLSFNKGFVSLPSLPEGLVAYNPVHAISDVIQFSLYPAIFSIILVTIFDTTGTVLGVAKQAGLMQGDKLPRARRTLVADSVGTLFGAIFGTTPTSAYIESASGVAAGGRTGLTSVFVALFFAIAAFFGPMISAISGIAAITSPALVIVGALMLSNVRHIVWDDFDEAFPAFIVILTMPLTSSIATGIAFGFISYPLMKMAKGKWKAVHPLVYIFAVLFVIQLVFFPH
ncbi:NCS2 family permease [Peribacillus kribbensis]|uniref:NCS2 family permease n=1 Tax=Peribacillus kribbensis TaxID=356658 RepID=UPI0004108D57|nr:NCS2 family permease [Peribacillus kribbensis]